MAGMHPDNSEQKTYRFWTLITRRGECPETVWRFEVFLFDIQNLM